MKKLSLLFLVVLVGVLSLNAQVLYNENFDSYTNGVKVAQTIGSTWWTTWSNAPGGAEDAVISNSQSVSPSNSIYVSGTNDLVFKCGNKTSGRYQLSWKMFVPTGMCGYFNMLHVFNGSSSQWAFEVFIHNNVIDFDDYSTSFALNTWHDIKFIIDIDDDFATFFVDGTEFVSFPWTDGSYNGLAAINFYAGSYQTQTPQYYIDDLSLEQVSVPEAPQNLTATVNGDNVDLAWDATTITPDDYVITRNNIIIATSGINSYSDIQPWPNQYTYQVKAFYGVAQGYSHSSNSANAIITGGTTRNVVLFEGGTGTWCPYCPGAAMGIRDMIDVNQKDAIAIEYHWGNGADKPDIYMNDDDLVRLTYYSISSFPTMVADGLKKVEGGSGTQSLYSTYLPLYEERFSTPALQNIIVDVTNPTVDNFVANITIENFFEPVKTNLTLHVALVESNIQQNWQNQTELDFVLRKMYPSATGTSIDFTTNNTLNYSFNFNISGYVKNNCQLVVFVQHEPTKEVTQTSVVDLSTIPLSIGSADNKNFAVYPNPAKDFINISSNVLGNVQIKDVAGRTILSSEITQNNQNIDISDLEKGIYFVVFTSNQQSYTQKLIIE